MIKIESNRDSTKFTVLDDDKVIVFTSSYAHAVEVYERAKANDIDFIEKMFTPFTPLDPKTLLL
jgi:hypothetical protein